MNSSGKESSSSTRGVKPAGDLRRELSYVGLYIRLVVRMTSHANRDDDNDDDDDTLVFMQHHIYGAASDFPPAMLDALLSGGLSFVSMRQTQRNRGS
jgi:hypothetical protein